MSSRMTLTECIDALHYVLGRDSTISGGCVTFHFVDHNQALIALRNARHAITNMKMVDAGIPDDRVKDLVSQVGDTQ